MVYRRVISDPAKMTAKLEAFKSVWKDSLKMTTTVDETDGSKHEMHNGLIGEIPTDVQMERIFYAYYGFKSRKELRDKLSSSSSSERMLDDFYIRLMPTMRDCIPNSEYYDDVLCDVFSSFDIDTRKITGKLTRAMEKRKSTITKFFSCVHYFIENGFETESDWEMLNGVDIDHIFEHDTRAIIYLSEGDIRDYVMNNSYSEKIIVVNSKNMHRLYQNALENNYDGTVFKVRVTSLTDFELLYSLIGNTTLSGANWLIDFPKKLSEKEEFKAEFVKLQTISDAIMLVK